jgi:hypothetical protein
VGFLFLFGKKKRIHLLRARTLDPPPILVGKLSKSTQGLLLAHDVPNKLNTDKVLVVVSFGPLRRKGPSL